jgi:hypothetical protein
MPTGDVVASVAYTLSFALVETLILLLVVLLIGRILPGRWVVGKYTPLVSMLLLELTVMAIVFQHFIIHHLPKRNLVIGFSLLLALSTAIALRFPKVGHGLKWAGERLVVLSLIYIIFDVVGLIIVILRNL